MSRHVDGPHKGRVKQLGTTHSTWSEAGRHQHGFSAPRVPVRFRSFIRPSDRASVGSLSCCLFLGRVILNACFDTISGRVNNAIRCSRGAWSRVWIRPVVVLCQGHGQLSSRERTRTLLKETPVESSKVFTSLRLTVISCVDVPRFLQHVASFG